jgi:hypothetical protein
MPLTLIKVLTKLFHFIMHVGTLWLTPVYLHIYIVWVNDNTLEVSTESINAAVQVHISLSSRTVRILKRFFCGGGGHSGQKTQFGRNNIFQVGGYFF